MTALVKVVDEQFGKGRTPYFGLRLASQRVTPRDIIGRRVADEVAVVNRLRIGGHPASVRDRAFLVRIDTHPAEAALNRSPRGRWRALDEAEEVAAAIEAFRANRFIMLVDDRQVGALDQPVTLTPASEVVFLRLTPLVGG